MEPVYTLTGPELVRLTLLHTLKHELHIADGIGSFREAVVCLAFSGLTSFCRFTLCYNSLNCKQIQDKWHSELLNCGFARVMVLSVLEHLCGTIPEQSYTLEPFEQTCFPAHSREHHSKRWSDSLPRLLRRSRAPVMEPATTSADTVDVLRALMD